MKPRLLIKLFLLLAFCLFSSVGNATQLTVWHDTVAYEDMSYRNVELSEIDSVIAIVQALSVDVNNSDSIYFQFDQMIDLFAEFGIAKMLSFIESHKDYTASHFQEDYERNLLVEQDARNKIVYLMGYLSYTPCANVVSEFFLQLFPNGDIPPIATSFVVSDSLQVLFSEEQNLISKYTELKTSGCPMDFDGEMMTDIQIRNSELSVEVKNERLQKWLINKNSELGGIYIELINKRKLQEVILAENGFDDYVQYMYQYMYNRSYSVDEVIPLQDSIIKYLTPHVAVVESANEYTKGRLFDLDDGAETVVNILSEVVRSDFEELEEALDYMHDYHLYDIDTGVNRVEAGFCTLLLKYNAPFIFLNPASYNKVSNYLGLFHEFGHFYDAYTDLRERQLLFDRNLDLSETMSMGMQLLSCHTLAKGILSPDLSEAYTHSLLKGVVCLVLKSFAIDDFERQALRMTNPTVEKLNSLLVQINTKYFGDEYTHLGWSEYSWVGINHLFEKPFYYLSYAMSALPALSMWAQAYDDFDESKASYISIAKQGSFGDYNKTLASANVLGAFDEEVYSTIGKALELHINEYSNMSDVKNELIRLAVCPNPAQHSIQVNNLPNVAMPFDYCLEALSGQKIATGKVSYGANSINLESCTPGLYILTISGENYGRQQLKVFKH